MYILLFSVSYTGLTGAGVSQENMRRFQQFDVSWNDQSKCHLKEQLDEVVGKPSTQTSVTVSLHALSFAFNFFFVGLACSCLVAALETGIIDLKLEKHKC